ncbi:MAG: DUF2179 domain-containing protein [Anaerolineales bacterium]
MAEWFTLPALGGALLIFVLRVSDMSLDTLRMLFVMRGRKGLAWMSGFFQSLLFVIAFSSVLSNLDNPLNIVGYAAGFATGNVVGILIEARLAIGYTHLRIISSRRGNMLAEKLRESGYAVTEIAGRGKDGTVNILSCSIQRKNTDAVVQVVQEIDPEAFVTKEEVSAVRRGFWRA